MKKNPSEASKLDAVTPKPTQDNNFIEIKIPKLSFKSTNINLFLTLGLIIFAFLIGILTNRTFFLQNELKTQIGRSDKLTNQKSVLPASNINAAQNPLSQTKVDVASGHLPILGSSDAKVTVVEFSDLQCPFCKRFIDETYQQIYDDYIKTGKIKFAYRHYPLTTVHPNAEKAAQATECANEQSKFWEYEDLLFKNQNDWSALTLTDAANTFAGLAGQLGLDTGQFRSCLDSDKYKQNIETDMTDGSKAGVDGTPAFFINGRLLTGAQPFTTFQQLIDEELKK